jgi:hypothetical protein
MTGVRRFRKGLGEAIVGIILGAVLTFIVDSLEKNGLIPSYVSWGMLLISMVLNLMTVKSLRVAGVTYTVGWLLGTWLLKDMLSSADFAFNMIVPVLILILKSWYWLKKAVRK